MAEFIMSSRFALHSRCRCESLNLKETHDFLALKLYVSFSLYLYLYLSSFSHSLLYFPQKTPAVQSCSANLLQKSWLFLGLGMILYNNDDDDDEVALRCVATMTKANQLIERISFYWNQLTGSKFLEWEVSKCKTRQSRTNIKAHLSILSNANALELANDVSRKKASKQAN